MDSYHSDDLETSERLQSSPTGLMIGMLMPPNGAANDGFASQGGSSKWRLYGNPRRRTAWPDPLKNIFPFT